MKKQRVLKKKVISGTECSVQPRHRALMGKRASACSQAGWGRWFHGGILVLSSFSVSYLGKIAEP